MLQLLLIYQSICGIVFLSDRLTERLGRSHVDLECHIFQDSRFRKRPAQPISSCEGAYATSKDSRLGRRTGQPIRAGVRGPNASLETLEESQEEQQGAVCLLLGPPAAYIRVRPHALPSFTLRFGWHREVRKRVGTSGFSRGHHDTTTSHGTLGILVNTYSNV